MKAGKLYIVLLLAGACAGCQEGGFASRLKDAITGRTPRNAAVRMEDSYFPDERRAGINDLVAREFGKKPPYVERYEQIAQTDPDWLVRATAIRALNRARWKESTPIFVKALDDPHEEVRLEAAKALVNMPDPKSVPSLIRIVNSTTENRDVRIAAADALKHYRTLEVARALIAQLQVREFGIAWQSRRSLRSITGIDWKYDESAWLIYVTGPMKPFG